MKYNNNNFLHWLTGFTDGESNFLIFTVTRKSGLKNISFIYSIHLHIDDSNVLYYIQEELGMGTVLISEKTSSCKFYIKKQSDICKLINIFTQYNLNTTKYLDFLDWKKAFNIYTNRRGSVTSVYDEIVAIKGQMNNNNRTNFSLESYTGISWAEHVKINKYWLLGLIEGEGSFHLRREDIQPIFALKLTGVQLYVLEAIKVFLIKEFNLDKYTLYKLLNGNGEGISIHYCKADKNTKASYSLVIKDFNILYHYFLPLIRSMITLFVSKKKLDFEKLEIIAKARYYGLHLNSDIRRTLLRLSYTMNNYNLSNTKLSPPNDLFIDKLSIREEINHPKDKLLNENINYSVSKLEINNLLSKIELEPRFEHHTDGRVFDLNTGKLVRNNNNTFIYEVRKPDGTVILCLTIKELVNLLGTNKTSLMRRLNNPVMEDNWMVIFNHYIRRVKLYNNTLPI